MTGEAPTAAGGPPAAPAPRRRSRARAAWFLLPVLLVGLPAGVYGWSWWHHRAAVEALRRRDYEAARRELGPSLQVRVWSAEPHLLAARAARGAGAFDEAADHLRAARARGGDPDAVEREDLLLTAQRGDPAWVEGPLLGLLARSPADTPVVMEVLAPHYFRTYQLLKAQQAVRAWLEHEPDYAPAWRLLAQTAERVGNKGEAREGYRRALELDPADDHARLQLAGLLTDTDPGAALALMEEARRRLGDTPPVLRGLATCRNALGEADEARRLLDRLVAEYPDDPAGLVARARLAQQHESAEAAEGWFRRAAARQPFERDILYGWCIALERVGRADEAAAVRDRFRRVDEELSRLAAATRRAAEAPDDPAPRCEAGLILMRNGRPAEGARWLASALERDPGYAPAHRALADYYDRAGDPGRAALHRGLVPAGPPR